MPHIDRDLLLTGLPSLVLLSLLFYPGLSAVVSPGNECGQASSFIPRSNDRSKAIVLFSFECFTENLSYSGRSIIMHKYTFHFETLSLGFLPFKEIFDHEIIIVIPVSFNSFIEFAWFNNGLVKNSSIYKHTATSLMPFF